MSQRLSYEELLAQIAHLNDDEKVEFLSQFIAKVQNEQPESVQTENDDIVVEKNEAPIQPPQATGKKNRFFSLVKSFAPNFSSKYENKIQDGVSYLQKTSVHGIAATEGVMESEGYKSFMQNLKEKAFGLGVTVSSTKKAWFSPEKPENANVAAANIVQFTGEANAVNKLNETVAAMPEEVPATVVTNKVGVPPIIDRNAYFTQYIDSHREKYNYEYNGDDGSIIFNGMLNANSNLKFDYMKVNFLPELKRDLDKKVSYYDQLSKTEGKYAKMVDKYAKSVNIDSVDVIDLLNTNVDGDNLPESKNAKLRQSMIIYRDSILKENNDKKNALIKTSSEIEYLLQVSDRSVAYVNKIDTDKLTSSRKVLVKTLGSEFLEQKVGVNNIGELINRQKKNSVNSNYGTTEAKKPAFTESVADGLINKTNSLAGSINKATAKFGEDVTLLHDQKDALDVKIKKMLEIKDPDEEQKKEIEKVKEEAHDYFTKFDATYQHFAEEFNDLKRELGTTVGQLRGMKKSIPPEHKLGKIAYMWESRKIQKYNDGLIVNASPLVSHLFNNVGSMAKLEERMLENLVSESSEKFNNVDKVKDNYKRLSLMHVSANELSERRSLGDAYDVVTAYKDLSKSLDELVTHAELSDVAFEKQSKNVAKIEGADLGTYKGRYLQNTAAIIKNSCAKYDQNTKACLDDIQLKFDAFKRLYNNDPKAVHYLKELGKASNNLNIDTLVNSSNVIDKLASSLKIVKEKVLEKSDASRNSLIEKRDTVVLAHYNELAKTLETDKPAKARQSRKKAIANAADDDSGNTDNDAPGNDTPEAGDGVVAVKPKKSRSRKNTTKVDPAIVPEGETVNSAAVSTKVKEKIAESADEKKEDKAEEAAVVKAKDAVKATRAKTKAMKDAEAALSTGDVVEKPKRVRRTTTKTTKDSNEVEVFDRLGDVVVPQSQKIAVKSASDLANRVADKVAELGMSATTPGPVVNKDNAEIDLNEQAMLAKGRGRGISR